MLEILIIILIIFIGTTIQGMTSFGASMFMLPLLLLYFNLPELVPILVIFSIVMNGIILMRYRRKIQIIPLLPLIISAFVFTWIGAKILVTVNEEYLNIVIGFILLIIAITNFLGIRFLLKHPKKAYIPVGAISGLLNSISSLNGPPVVLFLSNQNISKDEFRVTLTTYFFINNITTIITFIVIGNLTLSNTITALYLIPVVIIGSLFGLLIGNKLNEKVFEKIILVFLFIMGIYLILFNYFNIQSNLI